MRFFRYLLLGLCFISFMRGYARQVKASDPSAPSPAINACPVSPHVVGYPAGGPRGNNDWYANEDRTIWTTFWGWDFVRSGPDEPDPKTGYEPGQKVLWYKPSEYPLTVTGRRIDGAAPPLVYD